jgi:outer membrane protein W
MSGVSKALGLVLLLPLAAFAQDALLDDTNEILQSSQIDVDGLYQERQKPSAADRLEKMRQKLEKRHENMVRKKIEDIRVQQENELGNKMRSMFNNGMNDGNGMGSDSVSTAQAAPQKVVAVEPAPEPVMAEKANRVSFNMGVANLQTSRGEFESNMNMGLSVDNMVNERIGFGIGVNYLGMDITDTSNAYLSNTIFVPNYSQGREMNYKRYTFNVNMKVFLATQSQIRPYIGGSLGYNRARLSYEDGGLNHSQNGINFGNEEFSTSYVSGQVKLGAEVHFSDVVGLNLDVRFGGSLSETFNDNLGVSSVNPDQRRLENVGRDIEDGEVASLNAGLLIKF